MRKSLQRDTARPRKRERYYHQRRKTGSGLNLPWDEVEKLVGKLYGSLILELDALDNGVEVAEAPKYRICTHLGARIRRLNGSWQDPGGPPGPELPRVAQAGPLACRSDQLSHVSPYGHHM